MDERTELIVLYDNYGELLTANQKAQSSHKTRDLSFYKLW